METRKKKKLMNLVMVLLILVIVFCGIMAVGNIKGWFGKKEEGSFSSTKISGVVNVERMGVGYSLTNGLVLKAEDKIQTKTGSTAELSNEENQQLVMNEKTDLWILADDQKSLELQLEQGEVLTDVSTLKRKLTMQMDTVKIETQGSVCSASMQTGSKVVNVYEGEVDVTSSDGTLQTVKKGESLLISLDAYEKEHFTVEKLQAGSLNEFLLSKLQNCPGSGDLCFTVSELAKVVEDRAAEKQAALEASLNSDVRIPNEKQTDGTKDDEKNDSEAAAATPEATASEASEAPADEDTSQQVEESGNVENNADQQSTSAEDNSGATEDNTGETRECTITILCDTILNNMDNLTSGKEAYVPANGCILSTSTVEFSEGETVFDVLNRVCSYAGIQLEYAWTPMYNSYYIEGINNLYEFDCGNESGWMYKVNGWFPNYGCSSYTLENGDNIVWSYTCNGLGEDVGAK